MSETIEDDDPAVANAVILWRIYDVLMGIYSNTNEEEARRMVQLHEDGYFVTPPPAYRTEEIQ